MLSDKSNAQCNSHCSFEGQYSELNCFKIGNYNVLATFYSRNSVKIQNSLLLFIFLPSWTSFL